MMEALLPPHMTILSAAFVEMRNLKNILLIFFFFLNFHKLMAKSFNLQQNAA